MNTKKECRIRHLPISFFSIILGLAGFTIAFQKAEKILGFPLHFSSVALYTTLTLFAILTIAYAVKLIFFRKEVRAEFAHPVKLSFFPTFSISLLLLSIAVMPISILASKYLWTLGALFHLFFTFKIISIWIHHTHFEIKHMNPAWFIPAVGNMLVPVAGVTHINNEVSWFFMSIGLFFWIILLVIFFNRIIFHNPLPVKLLPTLFILIAPPAVGFISLVKLTGEITNISKVFYYFGLFLTLLLLSQINTFRKIKFFLSWWAYSFPIAAITIASTLMYHETHTILFKYIASALFAILFALIAFLFTRTLIAVTKREICVEEED